MDFVMSAEFGIEKQVDGAKGAYVGTAPDGARVGELTFSVASPTLVIADHTGVDDSMRGTGLARALVERLVADAKAEGFKIVPLCPFVNAQRQKHPEWAEVFQL